MWPALAKASILTGHNDPHSLSPDAGVTVQIQLPCSPAWCCTVAFPATASAIHLRLLTQSTVPMTQLWRLNIPKSLQLVAGAKGPIPRQVFRMLFFRYGNARANLIALSGSDTTADEDCLAHATERFLALNTGHGFSVPSTYYAWWLCRAAAEDICINGKPAAKLGVVELENV
ncbi:hypothetical protein CDV36_000771 [Fusarium kuroshium]|uniref:Uncharacterized protein n=1 Tax=Fusarium kuroshium TaxID=2010991 RepID=A0A3M2SPQ4_9HYPO|nr:hypothetical protein CDV36_000771 [Fusarium kuroshium]